MSDVVDIFVPSDELIPLEELLELSGEENLSVFLEEETEAILQMQMDWDDVVLTITPHYEDSEELIVEMQMNIATWLQGRTDKKAKKVRRRSQGMVAGYTLDVSPEWDHSRKAQQIAQGIMAYYNYALMYDGMAIYNENGNREVGSEESDSKYWKIPDPEIFASEESRERKKASIEVMKREKIGYIDHLPVIADTSETTLRPIEDIVRRAYALWLVAERAEGMSQEEYDNRVSQYRVEDSITANERAFADDEDPREDYVLEFSQRWEACKLLLWSIGFFVDIARPDHFANVDRLREMLSTRTVKQMVAEAQLRSVGEVLDMNDLVYRYHWGALDAELYGKPIPAKLQYTVLFERHYALNWLIGYKNQDWDDVRTDT